MYTFGWLETNDSWRHVQCLVVRDHLIRSLSICLAIKLDKDTIPGSQLTCTILVLLLLDEWVQSGDLFSGPIDSVDFLSDQGFQSMSWTLLW